jgi:hypothetical protein
MGVAIRVPVDTNYDFASTSAPFDTFSASDTTLSPIHRDSTDAAVSSETVVMNRSGEKRTTKFTLAGGGGRYYREYRIGGECSSSDPATFHEEFVDVGAEIDRQISDRGHVGIRGGYVHETAGLVADPGFVGELGSSREISTYYGNPYFAHEWEDFGVGFGVLVSSRPLYTGDEKDSPFEDDVAAYPTAHLRFARGSKFYLSAHLWEGVPVYSGGGMFMVGFGGRPLSSLELYGAYCAEGPYEEESFLGRVTFDINRTWTMMTTFHFPTNFSNQFGPYEDKESAVSVGVSYRLISTK